MDQLLDMGNEQLMELFPCRIRRKISRGLKRKPLALIKKLRKKKKECPPNEKPDVVKTHLRDMIIVPEMTGSIVGVYNGKTFNQVEIKVKKIIFQFWHFPPIFVLLKVTCLVTLFDLNIQIFKNSPKLTIFVHF